jgi:hypothetical protein
MSGGLSNSILIYNFAQNYRIMKIITFIGMTIILCLQSLPIFAAEFPPTAIEWPIGAEELIDKAIGIKVEAQKRNELMFSEEGVSGHAFAKCLDELARILSESSLSLDQLKEKEGEDLKAKIAIWAIDRKARPERYARLEHLHVSDNPIGKVVIERERESKRKAAEGGAVQGHGGFHNPPLTSDGQPIRRPRPKIDPPPMVSDRDDIEDNRWIPSIRSSKMIEKRQTWSGRLTRRRNSHRG